MDIPRGSTKEPAHSVPRAPSTVMRIARNERLFKVFIIRHGPENRYAQLRVLTKETGDGTLELLAYETIAGGPGTSPSHQVRARAVPPDKLSTILARLVESAKASQDQIEVIAFAADADRGRQAEQLAEHGLRDAVEFE